MTKVEALKSKLKNLFWRLENLYFIKDKDGKVIPFKLNYAQMRFLKNKHNRNVILKARQQGFTTLACILFLDACLFTSNLSAGIIAHNLEDANSFFEDKVKFAYEQLDRTRLGAYVKSKRAASTERRGELKFSNGSKISVRTSFRSGTLQKLHVSEFGKICAAYPHRAKEIVTGAFNAVSSNGEITIESTAEGKQGYFYDYCQRGITQRRLGTKLTKLDFKLHFYAWWESPDYVLDPGGVVVPPQMEEYFNELEVNFKIKLSANQKAWYVKKEEEQREDMLKEFPAHEDEAFAQSIAGAYYSSEITRAEKEKRITNVPHEPLLKVHTVWDLGMNDDMTIWFFQIGPNGERRFIDYLENSGKAIPFYAAELFKKDYIYGKTILPHDANVRSLETGLTRAQNLYDLGFKDQIIIPAMKPIERVNAARVKFNKYWFDQTKCSAGLNHLRMYRKAWDDKAGCWKNEPAHDKSSHASDSFGMQAFADIHDGYANVQRRASNKHR